MKKKKKEMWSSEASVSRKVHDILSHPSQGLYKSLLLKEQKLTNHSSYCCYPVETCDLSFLQNIETKCSKINVCIAFVFKSEAQRSGYLWP